MISMISSADGLLNAERPGERLALIAHHTMKKRKKRHITHHTHTVQHSHRLTLTPDNQHQQPINQQPPNQHNKYLIIPNKEDTRTKARTSNIGTMSNRTLQYHLALFLVVVGVLRTSCCALTIPYRTPTWSHRTRHLPKIGLSSFRVTQSNFALALSTVSPSTANSGVVKGDTKGAHLLLTDLYISTGAGNQILKSINFRVDPKERWGIVGPNGCGG